MPLSFSRLGHLVSDLLRANFIGPHLLLMCLVEEPSRVKTKPELSAALVVHEITIVGVHDLSLVGRLSACEQGTALDEVIIVSDEQLAVVLALRSAVNLRDAGSLVIKQFGNGQHWFSVLVSDFDTIVVSRVIVICLRQGQTITRHNFIVSTQCDFFGGRPNDYLCHRLD